MYMADNNSINPSGVQSQDIGETNCTMAGLKILARLIARDLLIKRSESAKNEDAKLNIPDTSADSNEDLS